MGVSSIPPHNTNCSYCIQVRLSVFVHVIAWSPCSSLAPAIERACVEEIEHLPVSSPLRLATSSPSHRLRTRRSRRGNGDHHIHSEHHQHLLPTPISERRTEGRRRHLACPFSASSFSSSLLQIPQPACLSPSPLSWFHPRHSLDLYTSAVPQLPPIATAAPLLNANCH